MSELSKEAAPRWVKELASGRLPLKAIEKLRGLVPKKVREIKRLGHGGEQIADLVYHPTHGAVVRKVPLLSSASVGSIKQDILSEMKRVGLWEEARRMTGGKGQFAHLVGKGGRGTTYYQYSPPAKKELAEKLEKSFLRQHKLLDRAKKKLRSARVDKMVTDDEYSRMLETVRSQENKFYNLRNKLYARVEMAPETEKVLAKLKEKYPGLHDIRPANVVGGKIVDISPDVGFRTTAVEKMPKDPVGYSRKVFLSKGRSLGKQSPSSPGGHAALPAGAPKVGKGKDYRWAPTAAVAGLAALAGIGSVLDQKSKKSRKIKKRASYLHDLITRR